jgi:integrase
MAKALTDAGIRAKKPLKSGRIEIPDATCSGLYLSVYESGIKSFVLRYKRPGGGKSVRMTLGRFDPTGHEHDGEPQIGDPLSLHAARQLCARLQRDRKRGKDPAAENRLSHALAVQKADSTFAACAMQFLREYTITRADAPERRPRGWRESARLLGWSFPSDERDGKPEVITGSLCDLWNSRPVSEITPLEVAAVIDQSRRHGIPGLGVNNKSISSNRARKIHDVLHVMFGWLQGEHRVVTNPVAGLRRPKPPASRDRVLNIKADVNQADQLRWFWNACSEIGQPWEQLFKLLLLTGARRDEIGQMKWNELNDDRTMLRLSGSRTKNSRAFELPLPPLATKLINGIEPVSDEYVFTIAGRSAIAGYAKAKARLDAAMLKLAKAERGDDATIAPFRLHDLRRSCATGMADIGVQPHIIEACLNHISGAKASVAGIYNRATYQPEKRAALTLWAEHVERIASGQSAKVTVLPRAKITKPKVIAR